MAIGDSGVLDPDGMEPWKIAVVGHKDAAMEICVL